MRKCEAICMTCFYFWHFERSLAQAITEIKWIKCRPWLGQCAVIMGKTPPNSEISLWQTAKKSRLYPVGEGGGQTVVNWFHPHDRRPIENNPQVYTTQEGIEEI